jgi:hypothetical protein
LHMLPAAMVQAAAAAAGTMVAPREHIAEVAGAADGSAAVPWHCIISSGSTFNCVCACSSTVLLPMGAAASKDLAAARAVAVQG